MKILINKNSNIVKGHNIVPSPFYIVIEVPDGFNLTKVVDVEDGIKQKINELGELLFKDDILVDEETGIETFTEVIDQKKVISFEEKEFEYKSPIYENVEDSEGEIQSVLKEIVKWTQKADVPTGYIELDPVMIPAFKKKMISILSDPNYFTADEVLENLYQDLLDETELDGILADVFLSEDDIDLDSKAHAADTGPGFVQLLPGGQCKLKQTNIEASAKYFKIIEFRADPGVEIYLAGKKFENGIIELSDPIESGTIKFVNTTGERKNIYSYAIGYQEVLI